MVIGILTEKPQACLKVAEALADKKVVKKGYKKVPYYEISHKNKKIIVFCSVGHLYGLREKDKKGWTYPVYDMEWVESYKLDKRLAYTKDYLDIIKKLSKKINNFYLATDKDAEGETLGYNVLRFACGVSDAKRMEFSTLTSEDLIHAFENPKSHIDFSLATSGITRHELDWLWGINTSRALTLAVKSAGHFKVLSSGRVQSPMLYLLTKKEEEIRKFKPEPFWQVFAHVKCAKDVKAIHKKGKFTKKQDADKIIKKCKGYDANVNKLTKRKTTLKPYPAFNVTSLQTESYRLFGYSPKKTLDIAQSLYIKAYISYPRTSSEILDPKINFKKILSSLKEYSSLVKNVKDLKPVQGKKKDPAHIAIYPTHKPPKLPKLSKEQRNIYDLIVRRFIAAFYDSAIKESLSVEFDINKEIFLAKGTRTLEKGWLSVYPVKSKEEILPELKEGKSYKVKKLELKEDETKPPVRYTQGSVISEMEKRGLGTKATRHAILQVLYDRDYIHGKSIEVTDIGIAVAKALKKYVPDLTSEKLTRDFEKELELIIEGKKKENQILDKAKKLLNEILNKFRKHEKDVGKSLSHAFVETWKKESHIGKCPICGKGNLVIKKGKFGLFIACSKYPKCKPTFSIPRGFVVKSTGKVCKDCSYPVVLLIKYGRRPFETCLNLNCKSKEVKITKEHRCPHCGKRLVVRKTLTGVFLGCPDYPKCKHIEQIKD